MLAIIGYIRISDEGVGKVVCAQEVGYRMPEVDFCVLAYEAE